VSIEHFQWRAEECRRLAIDARNASDKAFWLRLAQCWQALEIHKPGNPSEISPERRAGDNLYWITTNPVTLVSMKSPKHCAV
jgi:hypothetical protein